VNLKHAEGRQGCSAAGGGADVLVENFRPGVMDRLGVGYEALKEETGPDLLRDLGLRAGRAVGRPPGL
jgi:crotonobetainyl-CoA:carnitine CoA-transferase CaiB-like acyl-CoA transferase